MKISWLANAAIDILLFVASEIIMTSVYTASNKVHMTRQFLIQLVLLAIFSVLVYYSHHVPYILISFIVAVLIRVVINWCVGDINRSNVSKPLKFAHPSTPSGQHIHHHQEQFTGSDSTCRIYPTSLTPSAASDKKFSPHGNLKTSVPLTENEPLKPTICQHISFNDIKPSPVQFSSPKIASIHPSSTHSSTYYHRPPGIQNSGNICFFNSTIQCFIRMNDFQTILSKDPVKKSPEILALIEGILSIMKQSLNWRNRAINPRNLMKSVSELASHLIPARGYQSQQDAAEFLLWLLDTLHEAYNEAKKVNDSLSISQQEAHITFLKANKNRLLDMLVNIDSNKLSTFNKTLVQLAYIDKQLALYNNKSPVYDLCCGQLLEARECQNCKALSVNLEYYTVLPLPVPVSSYSPVSDLLDCFSLFSEVEELTRDCNMLNCPCSQSTSKGLAPGKRLSLLSELPPQLSIQLRRFSYNTMYNKAIKNQSPVVFPAIGLNLTEFTMHQRLERPSDSSIKPIYDLIGFCVHTGAHSTSCGHYVSYAKVSDGQWYSFNDDYVTCIGHDIESAISKPFILQNAYLLFYSRQQL